MDIGSAAPSDVEPLVGTPFRIDLAEDTAGDLVLAAVERGPSDADARPFHLLFRGGPTPPLPQGIQTLTNEDVGQLDLFLVPATPDADGPLYVAVFG